MARWEGFAGRAAVVTGAGGGMGLQIARDLLDAGAMVTGIDVKDRPEELDGAAVRAGRRQRRAVRRPGDRRRVRRERPARLPGQCSGRAVVRARPLAARDRARGVEPGDRDQSHRLHADRAPRDPADAKTGGGAMVHFSSTQCLRGDDQPQDAYQVPRPAFWRCRSRSRSSSRTTGSARTSSCRARPRARCRRAGTRTRNSSGRPPPACRSAGSGPRGTWRAPACSCSPTRLVHHRHRAAGRRRPHGAALTGRAEADPGSVWSCSQTVEEA